MDNFGFYLVMTDPAAGYVKCCEAAVKAGVKMVQLRMKRAPREEIVRTAKELRRVTMGSETKFIVNDDPSIAAEAEADGVHVGQGDMGVKEVRMRFPELKIVGLSTHNLEQAREAMGLGPDYIGTGPCWATPTKDIPDPTLGLETAKAIHEMVPFPAVAIGGIDSERLPAVIKAGLKNWAVVRSVCRASDPYAAIRGLLAIAEEAGTIC
ncbi:MAG: thiamine phosphate synthase [Kiritimatiellae bacterium]|nr:thiamine phosphate synthase [Kiritimatiellia bacterium]